MNNETCIHDGIALINLLKNLFSYQDGSCRHKCPSCAFEQEFILKSSKKWQNYNEYTLIITDPEKCSESSIAFILILKCLKSNHGDYGRYKYSNCVFKHGFELGVLNEKAENNKVNVSSTSK